MARVLVPASRASLMAIGVFGATIALLWFWMAVAGLYAGGLSAWLVFPVASAMVFVFGYVAFWAVRRRSSDEPALIIDEVGLYDNVSITQSGRVKWRQMERSWLAGPAWLQFLCVMPDEIRAYLSSQPEMKRLAMQFSMKVMRAPIVIPMAVLDKPQEQVWQQIVEIAGQSRAARPPSNLATGS